jgi:AraC-like DNA-binding protein
MNLHVKHMISSSCILMAKEKLAEIGVFPDEIILGRITLKELKLDEEKLKEIEEVLESLGFKLLENNKKMLIDRIQQVVREIVHQMEERPSSNYSEFISKELGYDYTYISNLYSVETGKTIQQSIIELKIERAIELMDQEISFKQISYVLHYSSLAHFCSQFKKTTGFTPTKFKEMSRKQRENALRDLYKRLG